MCLFFHTHGNASLRRQDFCCALLLLVTAAGGLRPLVADTLPKPHDPHDDLGTLQFEYFLDCPVEGEGLDADQEFGALWGYVSLPGATFFSRSFFAAIEIDCLDRYYRIEGESLNIRPLQRFGAFAGLNILEKPAHRGTIMAGTGAASDFSGPLEQQYYLHLIYEHRLFLSPGFDCGLGVLFMNNFGTWKTPFNLLPYLNWQITPWTRLRVAWDVVELKQFIVPRFSVSAEARYDMSFFRLRDSHTLVFESVGAGGGCDIWLFNDWYLRVRYRYLLYRKDVLTRDEEEVATLRQSGGHVCKVLGVYAR